MKPCRDGVHSWKRVYTVDNTLDGDEVVRWCAYCGAIVIDRESDGRINPGAISSIQFPQLTLDLTIP